MPETSAAEAGAVLAFDFGRARTGVAVGDLAVALSHPVTTLRTTDDATRIAQIAPLVREWAPVQLVVGRPPGTDDGAPHALGGAIDAFAQALRDTFGLPVEFADESWSSADAASRLAEAGVRGRAQKAHLDAQAACVILDTWFSQRRGAATVDARHVAA
jgi:putative Holliday junction resolvase